MPRGPKGERRPADAIGAAIAVAKIATGERADTADSRYSITAAELGRKGGAARARTLSPKKRKEIAKRAAAARWSKNDR